MKFRDHYLLSLFKGFRFLHLVKHLVQSFIIPQRKKKAKLSEQVKLLLLFFVDMKRHHVFSWNAEFITHCCSSSPGITQWFKSIFTSFQLKVLVALISNMNHRIIPWKECEAEVQVVKCSRCWALKAHSWLHSHCLQFITGICCRWHNANGLLPLGLRAEALAICHF
jgi:hypothetical protein